jgi:hypothetical protein
LQVHDSTANLVSKVDVHDPKAANVHTVPHADHSEEKFAALFTQQQALQEQNQKLQDLLGSLRDDQLKMASRVGSHKSTPVQTAPDLVECSRNGQQTCPEPLHYEGELQLFKNLLVDGHHVSDEAHAGVPTRHTQDQKHGSISRDDLAVLHAAGYKVSKAAYDALHSTPVPPLMELERGDLNTISSIILQFISFAPSDAFNMPQRIHSIFMRFQLFDFAATQSDTYRLEPGQTTHVRPALARTRIATILATMWGYRICDE